jgi:hypothetical protein
MQQQENQQETIGQAAIKMVAVERFQQRQKVLEWMLQEGKLPETRGYLLFQPGLMIQRGATLHQLQASLDQAIPEVNREIREAVQKTIAEFAANNALDQVSIEGKVLGYTDHPDGDFRAEIQIWTDYESIPSLVLTFALRLSSERGRSFWHYTGFKPYREEWPNMMLEVPQDAPAEEFPRVDPEKISAPPLGAIFMSRDQRLGIEPESKITAPTEFIMGEPEVAVKLMSSSQVPVEEDGMVSLFGPSPQRMAEIAAGNREEELSMGEKIKRLIARGHRMSDADLAIGGKMKVDVKTRADAKHFLDEVFRNGNLWLYNQLNAALEANERNLDFVFELSINGNWQEYRGPIEADVKLKAYWSKDPVRVHKVFSINGPVEIGVIVQ